MISAALRSAAAAPPRAARAMTCCHWFDPVGPDGENVWQVDASSIRFGRGALAEVGDCVKSFDGQPQRVALFTDRGQADLPHVLVARESLAAQGLDVAVYDEVRVEPTDGSFMEAAAFAREGNFDAYVSVGGGSVMDTCKAAQLYATFPTDLLAFVNKPIGRGEVVPHKLPPHVACPTTAGTGSECTGLAIFDLTSMHAKTGIASRRIRPDAALIDPMVMDTLPSTVTAASGFDVLSHALESYTARPYTRQAKADPPSARPMSQGANPWSDFGCENALKLVGKYLVRAANDAADTEARDQMLLASTLAGIAFGNAGCALPHALSYSVSGNVRDFCPSHGYEACDGPIVPHGYSVILNAPSVFRFQAHACPDRHLRAAEWLGADVRGARPEDAGEVLAGRIIEMMQATEIPNGLRGVGYDDPDIPMLTEGAMPQRRLLDNAPCDVSEADVSGIYKGAMLYW